MSEPAENMQPQFNLQRVYTKDISFETPNSPDVFLQEWKPDMDLNLGIHSKELGENNHEITLTVTVTVKSQDKTAFLVEVQQAGIFQIEGVPEDQLDPIIHIMCPNILFPYAREVVSDLVSRGSFPQLLLAPVNFETIYAHQMQAKQQEAGEATH